MLRKSAAILLVLLSLLANEAFALGLGRVSVESSLNQPLRVRIEVLQLGDTRLEDVTIQLAAPEDFERFNIERASFLNNIRFTTESTSQGDYVVLTTSQIVREPYLSFILETRWSNGRLLSEHTILLDLPVYEDDAVPEAPVRRPIGSTIDSQRSNTVEPTPTAPPASSQPSVQPVLEPESIAPDLSAASAPAEQIDSDDTPQIEDSDQEAADQEAADSVTTAEEDSPASNLNSQADESVEIDESLVDEELDAVPVEEQAEELPDETAVDTDSNEALAQEEVDTEDALADAAPETMTVGATDTLSAIALQVRPNNNVSIAQTMLAIQELNPDAFAGGNINRLRQGAVLRIPSLSDIQAVSQREALTEVSRQNSALDVQPLAAPTQAATTANETDGQLSVVTADPDADSTDGSGVTEESDTAALDQRIAQLEDQLALKEEEADRARIEKEELESRLAELEEQIAAAQEIIRLRDLQLAQLQQSLADAAAEADRVAEAQVQAVEEEIPAESVTAAPQAQESESFVASLVRAITSNSLILIAGVVALILLLAGVLVWRNRSNRDDEERLDVIADDEFAGVTETPSVEEQAFEQDQVNDEDSFNAESELHDYEESELDSELDAFMSVGSESATLMEEVDTEDEQNLLEQVDVLIKHEQLQQAETLLEEAIAADPDDHILQMKRLEVLVAQGDAAGFESHAGPLEIVSDSDERSKIAAWRTGLTTAEIDEQPLGSTITEVDAQRQKDETASFLDDLGIDLDSFEDDAFQLSDDDPDATNSSTENDLADAVSAVEETETEAVDLTFDLSSSDEAAATEETPITEGNDDISIAPAGEVEVELENAPTEDSAELPEMPVFDSIEEADEAPSETESELPQGESKDVDDLEIDSFEFDLDEQEADEPQQADKEEDLELETFSFETPEIEVTTEEEPVASNEGADDGNGLDFDFDKSEITAEADSEELAEVEAFDFDLEGDSTDTVVEKAPDAGAEAAPESSFDSPASDTSTATADDFDFDLSDLEIDADEANDENIEIELSDDDFLDLDDELLSDDSAEKNLEEDTDSSIEFEFDEEVTKSATADTVVESAVSDDDLDFLADEDVVFEAPDHEGDPESLSDEEETATKLELAYAYQKMGDADGAREILQEVIAEGSESQVKEATDLISAIDANPE